MKKLVTFIIVCRSNDNVWDIFAKDISVGYVLVGPSNDGGWSMRHSMDSNHLQNMDTKLKA